MRAISRPLARRYELITNSPERAVPVLPVFLFDDFGIILFQPLVQLLPRIRLAYVGCTLAIARTRQFIHVLLIAPFSVRKSHDQMSTGTQEPEHICHGRICVFNMFKYAYAGDEIEHPHHARMRDIIIQDEVMPILHSRAPIGTAVVDRSDKGAAAAQQLRQRRFTGAHVEDAARVYLSNDSEQKGEFNRPLVEPPEYLLLELPSALQEWTEVEDSLCYAFQGSQGST